MTRKPTLLCQKEDDRPTYSMGYLAPKARKLVVTSFKRTQLDDRVYAPPTKTARLNSTLLFLKVLKILSLILSFLPIRWPIGNK